MRSQNNTRRQALKKEVKKSQIKEDSAVLEESKEILSTTQDKKTNSKTETKKEV